MKPGSVAPLVALLLLAAGCSSGDSEGGATEDPTPASTAEDGEETEAGPSVTDTTDSTDTTAESAESTPEADATAVEAEMTVEASPYIGLVAEVSIASDAPVHVELTATAGEHVVAVPRTTAIDTELSIPLVGLRAEQTYALSAELFDGTGQQVGEVAGGEFATEAVPEWFDEHELTIDADRAAPGYTLVEFDTFQTPEGAPSSQHLVAYDDEGEVVWYYLNTGALGAVEPTTRGTLNMLYWPFGIREVDLAGNVVNNWRPQPSESTGDSVDDELVVENVDPDQVEFQGGFPALVGNPGDAEPTGVRSDWIDIAGVHHENWPMPNGNVLTLSTTVHELTPEQRATFCPDDPAPFNAMSDIAVEFEPSGRVVRTWDLWDAIDIDEFPGRELCVDSGIFAGTSTRDWTHANSVVYDPERDAVLISSRHTDQIVAFDHLDEEGPQSQLRWIIGAGGTMPLEGEPTYYQHAVEVIDDGSIIVYDNGNFRPGTSPDDPDNPPFSRAVIYDVDDSSDDPDDWSARQVWEHVDVDDEGNPVYSSFISDADMLDNGNVLITHGGIGSFPSTPEDPLHVLIREVVPEGDSGGEVVWELKSAPGKVYTAYRAERIPSFYFGPDWET